MNPITLFVLSCVGILIGLCLVALGILAVKLAIILAKDGQS